MLKAAAASRCELLLLHQWHHHYCYCYCYCLAAFQAAECQLRKQQ